MSRQLVGELISEAVAMFIIIALGDSVAAMYILYDPSPYQNAYWGVCIAWGLAVTLAIYVTGSVSGTYANPAVTLALALFRGFSWKKVLPYWVAQVIGAFLGAAIVYQLYGPVIDHFNQLHQLTREAGGAAGVFFTAPGLAVTPMHALVDQIIITAFLIFGIFAITEQFNEAAPTANSGVDDRLVGRHAGRVDGLSGSLGDEPGTRFRPAPVRVLRRLGRGRLAGQGQLLVDPDRWPVDRWSDRRAGLPVADPAVPAGAGAPSAGRAQAARSAVMVLRQANNHSESG
ncbi:membrane hypothetical protein [Xanthomonas citri pv. citri]|nr:membrane hypothetical protein [Xanthomonas citri pv. citri]